MYMLYFNVIARMTDFPFTQRKNAYDTKTVLTKSRHVARSASKAGATNRGGHWTLKSPTMRGGIPGNSI